MAELEQFDWETYAESVKAGTPHKVVTRDGREVTQLVQFDVASPLPLRGVIGGNIDAWHTGGKTGLHCGNNSDLFFAPRTRTVWILIWGVSPDLLFSALMTSAIEATYQREICKKQGWHIIEEFTREIPA